MIKSIHLTTLIWGAFLLLGGLLILEGTQITTGLFKPCGTVVTIIAFALLIFDKWLWSFHFLHPWFVDRPYLKGTWKGTLKSTYVQPETKEEIPPIEVYLVIRQTFSAIHMRLISRESSSESMANNIPRGEDGVYSLASVYRNTPNIAHRGRSPIHHGAMLLRVEGDPPASLSGDYWTDRLTVGEVQFTHRSGRLYYDFDSATAGTFLPS
jgi:hypothetical protein